MAISPSLVVGMLVQTAIWLGVSGALLFLSAAAWVLLAELGVLSLVSGFAISRREPALLRERTASPIQKDQKSWYKIQAERKHQHQVVSTGPYTYARHPMYVAAVPLIVGMPLLLGSWWGLVWATGLVALLGFRAVLEEDTLKAELEGYEAYAAPVRYLLVPGVW
jgi:hypothetical protein